MTEKKIIKLYNRYKEDICLEQIEENIFKFISVTSSDFIFNHMRVGYADNEYKEISFIDPPGGPFLRVGADISDEYSIKKIECKVYGNGVPCEWLLTLNIK